MPSSKKDINQQLRDTIYKKVTKKTHNHGSPKKNGDGTIKKCIELFKEGASSEVLTKLEKSLREQLEKSPEKQEEYQKHYKYYIEDFLPALKTGVMELEVKPSVSNNEIEQLQRSPTRRGKIVETILEITNRSSDKDHSSSTIQNQKGRRNNQIDRQDNALGLFKNKSFSSEGAIAESSGSSSLERDSLAKGVSGKGTPGTYKILRSSGHNSASAFPTLEQSQLNGSFNQSDLSIDCKDLKNEKPSATADAAEVPSGAKTSNLSNDNGSDSGVSLGELSKESLKSPVSSRRSSLTLVTSTSSEESVNSIPSVAEENNNLQKENENQVQLEQAAPEEPQVQESGNSGGQEGKISSQVKEESAQVSSQCLTLGSREKESMDPNSQTTQMTGSQVKDSMQSKEKEEKAVLSKQEASNNENNSEVKQPNNRNLRGALIAGCALSTIGCIVAGAMTSGLVGAGLLAMAAVFAIAAVAELHSNFLSSKLTSISVEPHVNDKELTACSQR